MVKRYKGEWVFDTINNAAVGLFTLLCLYPILYTLSLSLSDAEALAKAGSVDLFPVGFSLDAYRIMITDEMIPVYYMNSAVYALGSTLAMLLVSSLTGYALSIKTFCLRKPLLMLMTVTMFIGGGLIPTYLVIRSLGLVDKRMVMILPAALNVWNCIIFKTFFSQNPAELRESAYLDGANDLRILFQIIIPVSAPLLATFSIFGIVGSWNDYFTALIYLRKEALMPIQLLLRRLLVTMEMQEEMKRFNAMMGGTTFRDIRTVKASIVIITMFPIMVVYPFFQKYFTKGILIGTIKG